MTVHKKNQYQHQVSTNINTGKTLGFSLSAMRQIHFFGGYLCNVTLFISLDHLNKLWIIRRFKTLPNTQNLLFNIYIISKSKHAQKEYMTDIKSFFYTSFSNQIILPEKDPECVQSELFTYVDGMRSAFSTW